MAQTNREYAEALFALALEENQVSEYSRALGIVSDAIEQSPEYIDFLVSPAVPISERLAAIDEAFESVVPEHVLSFLKILCENRQAFLLAGCIKEFEKLVQASSNRTTAIVYSVIELTSEQKSALCQRIERVCGKSIDLVCLIDPSLIGGIKIEVDGKIFDGSIKQRLHEVKEVIN
ncbi:MAG: ATP synthase F1 subunit delta [Clostridia bacterium]|nr:ATP synthase F1 subunit delta [Clostridia bacterium]